MKHFVNRMRFEAMLLRALGELPDTKMTDKSRAIEAHIVTLAVMNRLAAENVPAPLQARAAQKFSDNSTLSARIHKAERAYSHEFEFTRLRWFKQSIRDGATSDVRTNGVEP
jgi:hypothetical protein